MDRQQILSKLASGDDERLTLGRVWDALERFRARSIPQYTAFLTPQEQAAAGRLLALEGGEDDAVFFGGYDGAERKILAFLPDYLDCAALSEADGPVGAVRCTFYENDRPTHRDFLGALMGLGLRRDVIGDLLVTDGACDLLLRREILPFVLENFQSAGRTRLKTAAVRLSDLHLPVQQSELLHDTVASVRLDSVLSSAFRISRSKAADLIRAGRAEQNWNPCDKPDRPCAQGDVLTLRGFGKCRLAEIGGASRKGRINLVIERYR